MPFTFNSCILIFLFTFLTASCQKRIYLDENKLPIKKTVFLDKWKDKELLLSRWDSIGKDGNRYSVLSKGLYLKGYLDYDTIKEELEKIAPLISIDNNIILIEYYYKDDLCSSSRDNKWTKNEIRERKSFLFPIRKKLNQDNIVHICIFENGIDLSNKPENKDEYFFLDKNDFFRSKIFTNSTLCGSFAAIKTNNQILVRNGEFRADSFAKYLHSENWSLFFPPESYQKN